MLSKALECASVSIGAPFWGTWRDISFLGPLREGKNLFREIFYEEFERYVKKRSCKRAAVSIGALLGKLEGVHLLGLLREKENAYLGSFSWTQRTLNVKSGGHLEL
jgi:hypothetical protein